MDRTKYHKEDIGVAPKHDDVLAARLASARVLALSDTAFERWVLQAGPLPFERGRKTKLVDCVKRGLTEVSNYLDGVAWR